MSSFFHSVTDISESGNDDSSAVSQIEDTSQAYSSSFGTPPNTQAVNLRRPQGNDFRQSLLVHALLEERCINEVLADLNAGSSSTRKYSKSDAVVQARAAARYNTLCTQLNEHGLIATGPETEDFRPLRRRFQDGLTLLSQTGRASRGTSSASSNLEMALTNLAIAGPAHGSSLPQFPGNHSDALMPSHPLLDSTRYVRDFKQTGMLGKGGYGTVFQVQHRLDGLSYAVKKIPIGPTLLHKIQRKGQSELDAILIELRTMARMEHPNIVRYYSGWIEWSTPQDRTPLTVRESRLLQGPSASVTESEDSPPHNAPSQGAGDPSFGEEGVTFGASVSDDDGILFEDSDSRSIASRGTDAANLGSDLPVVERIRSRNTLASVRDDDDVEVIARDATASSIDHSFTNTGPETPSPSSLTLHIQMSLYHMTLSEYLRTDAPDPASTVTWRHCFHLHGSAQILLAIIDGVEYLHSEGIVHRDLKPGNVFLATRTLGPSPHGRQSTRHHHRPAGTIDPFACKGCQASAPAAPNPPVALHICIGDFGLVSAIQADQPSSTPTQDMDYANPESLITQQSSSPRHNRAVGTPLYRPPDTPTANAYTAHNHSSLDIYSLGIIFFELLWPFGTRMERSEILNKLRDQGEFPVGFPEEAKGLIADMLKTPLEGMQGLGCEEVRARLLTFMG